jgi:GNAT superfamily N-acetyltransferase
VYVLERVGTQEDVPEIAACLASAFYDDPVWSHWALPDETTREARLRELMGFWIASNVRFPTVWLTDACESVAAWIPPGEPDLTRAEQQLFGPLIEQLFGDRAGEVDALFGLFEENHPEEPHYYLSLWGTNPAFARQGLGTKLINHCLAIIDGAGMPAYLESSNPANLPRYEAFGFEPQIEFSVPGSPVITTMWREPR